MSDPVQHVDVVVIGGGLSGLATAHLLQRRGRSVALLERAPRFGGAIRSWREDGHLIEAGPNSALETTPLIGELLRGLGIEGERIVAAPAGSNRYILRDGRLLALPLSPPAFLRTPLFTWRAKLRLLREPWIAAAPPEAEETVAQFVRRRLGDEFLDYAINPFVAGVYAGDPGQLSVPAAFPKLHALEQRYGSLIRGQIRGARERRKRAEAEKTSAPMITFREGMETLTDALAATLAHARVGMRVERVRQPAPGYDGVYTVEVRGDEGAVTYRARSVVIAAPAAAAAELSAPFAPELASALAAIPYPPVAVVVTVYDRIPGMHPLDGFGFLIPKKEGRRILGTIFSSTLFPGRCGDDGALLTSFVGGMRQPDEARRPADEVLSTVRDELRALLGTPAEPRFARVTQWERAIPQYTPGHRERIAAIERVEAAHPGLRYCANYRGGIAVADCVTSAFATADTIEDHLVASGA